MEPYQPDVRSRLRWHLAFAWTLLGLGLALVAFGVWWAKQPLSAPGTDGEGYALMGAFEFALILLVGSLCAFITWRIARRRAVLPPGWYPDPFAAAAWRWWDGQRWTGWTG